jgi:hypothetical protein
LQHIDVFWYHYDALQPAARGLQVVDLCRHHPNRVSMSRTCKCPICGSTHIKLVHRQLSLTICRCGSGKSRRPLFDARQIFIDYVCDTCEGEVRKSYRPEIFTDPNYQTEEPID